MYFITAGNSPQQKNMAFKIQTWNFSNIQTVCCWITSFKCNQIFVVIIFIRHLNIKLSQRNFYTPPPTTIICDKYCCGHCWGDLKACDMNRWSTISLKDTPLGENVNHYFWFSRMSACVKKEIELFSCISTKQGMFITSYPNCFNNLRQ